MRILFLGDVMGRSGREAIEKHLPDLKSKLKPDVIIVNAENAAHGFGMTEKICKGLLEMGVDCITSGNHVWDQRDFILYIDKEPRVLRPANFPAGTPGKGSYLHQLDDGRKILIANYMGRIFMDPMDDPFAGVQDLLKPHTLGKTVDAIFVDFHGETNSEKMSFAHMLDGRISGLVGTHTHTPTADATIFSGGTAYQSDAGMCGDYDSVIGMRKDIPIAKFTRKMPTERFSPADQEGTVCGVLIETNDNIGLAKNIGPVVVGPRLRNVMPDF
ncbi:MAG: TIGR00282 family metallophosphoesterase [Rhodospirillales bacterium]|nr:TIGR00282 family metallophosphoesterase [Rhodospirillales bacterium]MCB9995731.1 TIGR00282 family metallophosphoesterase [Rhodospirillales bacterium]